MAAYLFTRAILAGEPIKVFNEGRMARDFTYIDDIVAGTFAAHDRPPAASGEVPHRIYNLGNHRPEKLLDFIAVLERALGRTARKELLPLQPGDVPESFADIEASRRDLGFEPKTTIEVGLARFVEWYKMVSPGELIRLYRHGTWICCHRPWLCRIARGAGSGERSLNRSSALTFRSGGSRRLRNGVGRNRRSDGGRIARDQTSPHRRSPTR